MKLSLTIIALSLSIISCMPKASENSKNITVTEAYALIESNSDIQIIDVRTPDEWSNGIIENAIKINIKDSDFATKLAELDKDSPTLVYCKSGGRSARATVIMEELGFRELYNMLGGYDAVLKGED